MQFLHYNQITTFLFKSGDVIKRYVFHYIKNLSNQLNIFTLVFAFLFFMTSSIAYGLQEVYLADNLVTIKVMKALANRPRSSINTIITDFVATNHLVKLTPQLARERFNITWQNLPVSGYKFGTELPRLVVVNMGPEVGYGLFTLDHIPTNRIIVEYEGDVITDKSRYTFNPYIVNTDGAGGYAFRKVDGTTKGIGRFVQHLPTDISGYDFSRSPRNAENKVATANSILSTVAHLGHRLFLASTAELNFCDQIGFDYGNAYRWSGEPCLFTIAGDIIRPTEYVDRRPRMLALDTTLDSILCPFFNEEDLLRHIKSSRSATVSFPLDRDYPDISGTTAVVSSQELEEKLAKSVKVVHVTVLNQRSL